MAQGSGGSERKMAKDSVTHAPEAGEPAESGRTHDQKGTTADKPSKSSAGKARLGEDHESGRHDSTP